MLRLMMTYCETAQPSVSSPFHGLYLFESELIIPSLALLHIETAQRI